MGTHCGVQWGSLRGQVSGINEFGDAAHRYLQTAGDVPPSSVAVHWPPNFPCGNLARILLVFILTYFNSPISHSPLQSWLLTSPNPGAGPSSSPTLEEDDFHSPYHPVPSPSETVLPLHQSSTSVSDSYTIVSSAQLAHPAVSLVCPPPLSGTHVAGSHASLDASSAVTKSDLQAAFLATMQSLDTKKELSMSLPRFNGNPTKFSKWYTLLSTDLSTPAWRHIHLA